MKHFRLSLLCLTALLLPFTAGASVLYTPADPAGITMGGELAVRVWKNFDRLEDDIFRPDSIFKSQLAESWPGDAQGRVILGLVCDARSSGRKPLYLSEILRLYPEKMNKDGYFGPLYDGVLNEQQLSGNGWVLRGLCEYYEWTRDKQALAMISNIVDNLFMHGKGVFKEYPIDPEQRRKNLGDAIGEIVYNQDRWVLSSDIGCIFIGMEGLIHSYKLLRRADLKELIDELIGRFLEIDLVAIRAQTHASLTACRGLIRYAEITGEEKYVEEAAKRWELYRQYGMTDGFQNYNWFCRYDTWSEPCAVVDSYMVPVQLWMHTGKPEYLEQAELIYYNGLCHTQRSNGGFGCDFCPSVQTGRTTLGVRTDEAFWCCTMRGAEGLASAVKYSWFVKGNGIYVPFFHESTVSLGRFQMTQKTDFPFEGKVTFTVDRADSRIGSLNLRMPYGASDPQLTVNGQTAACSVKNGFVVVERAFKKNDRIELVFNLKDTKTTKDGMDRYFRGPLLLGQEKGTNVLTPVWHLMESRVNKAGGYTRQILFPSAR